MVSELIVKVLESLYDVEEVLEGLDEMDLYEYEFETLKLLVQARMKVSEAVGDLEDALDDI